MILVTHNQEIAARADRIVLLADGRINGARDGIQRHAPR